MNNVNYNYVRITVDAKDVTLIIDEFTRFFKAYKVSGYSSRISNTVTISGYITESSFHNLSETAKHYATVKLDLEELIECYH